MIEISSENNDLKNFESDVKKLLAQTIEEIQQEKKLETKIEKINLTVPKLTVNVPKLNKRLKIEVKA